jgi:hypothetical protein
MEALTTISSSFSSSRTPMPTYVLETASRLFSTSSGLR